MNKHQMQNELQALLKHKPRDAQTIMQIRHISGRIASMDSVPVRCQETFITSDKYNQLFVSRIMGVE